MTPSRTASPGYVLRAADGYYQNIFCNNIEYAPGRGACTAARIDCPKCGSWRQPKIWYPSIDCSNLMRFGDGVCRYLKPGDSDERHDPFDPEAFKRFANLLAPDLGPSRPAVPGMVCGVWPGWAIGQIGDFAWRSESNPMVRESVFRDMLEAGFPVVGGATPIRAKHEMGEGLIQLEIPPVARLSSECGFLQCEICGNFEPPTHSIFDTLVGRSKHGMVVIVDEASFDDSIPIQRILERPENIIVSAALGAFINARRFSDIAIEPVEFR